eukprot:PITA_27115
MRPQLHVQPNPNPNNNKALQVIDIQSQPALPMQCNDIHLRSGRIVEPIIDDITDSEKEETRKEKSSNKDTEILESSSNKTDQIVEPPLPERLTLTKTFEPPAFNLLGELQNLYVKIPLLQALRDVLIYARTVRDICVRKPGRKAKEPLTVHVMGELTALMTKKDPPVKYGDLGHPTVTVQVGKTFVSKVLVDLGATINIMTLETTQLLQLKHLIRETPTILELADRSTIKPEEVIEDLVISVESWNYPADFVVLQTKTKLGGHPLILGRPWLATAYAFISCRSRSMIISNGQETKQLTLYPHATPMINNDNSIWVDYEDEETQPILTVGQALTLKDSTEDELISKFNFEPSSVSSEMHNHLTAILESESQNNLETENLSQILAGSPSKSITVEIEPGKTLNINPNLTDDQKQQLIKLLKENKEAFAWDYTDMKGISPELCTHRIYIKEGSQPVCQPQRRMNPNLREIVKEELQKLLNAGFIYPISDSEWVSLLVIVPKKNGKWRVCVEYRALNKATQKDHFPLPFIDQVLDNLAGKKFFSFLDGFSGYNQIRIAPQYQDKTTFTSPWGTFAYRVLPFGLCNAPSTFQRAVIGIFSDMINDSLEIFMDDFTPYGTTFENALQNLEKVLKRCIEAHLALSTEKCHMMMNEGIVLGHFVSLLGIQVDPAKIQVNFDRVGLPIPKPRQKKITITPTAQRKRKIIQQSARYNWISGCLFHTGLDQEIRRCIGEDQIYDVLKACHDGPCGGHFADKRTTHKVLMMGYYWPSIFKDAKKYVRACDSCQRMGQPNHRDEMPLNPQVILEPFERWAIDFIGPINPPSNQRVYILVCTDYMTKWVEAKALIKANEELVLTFLFEEIFVRYGLPRELVTDGGPPFNSHGFKDTLQKYHIKHRMTTPYHPQSNGQVESTNKFIEAILTKTIKENRRDWFQKLPEALWAYRTTWKNTTGFSPYELVFGKNVVFPLEEHHRLFTL